MNREAGRMFRTWRIRAPAAMLVLVLVGCDRARPPIGSVSGKVTLNGKPVTKAEICFASDDGYGASTPLSSDGGFQLGSQYGRGIPLGSYRVAVVPLRDQGAPGTPMTTRASTKPSEIPTKYQDMMSSGLTAKVDGQQRVFTFDLR
jgi:hypothetical protein